MSSESPPNASSKSSLPAALEVESYRRNQRSDWLLAELISTFNKANVGIGITVMTGGSLVSGTIITPEEYFAGLGKQVEAAFQRIGIDKAQSAQLGELFKGYGERAQPKSSTPDQDKAQWDAAIASGVLPLPLNPRSYIHLKDAKILSQGNTVVDTAGSYWRGRIAAIEGFMLSNIA